MNNSDITNVLTQYVNAYTGGQPSGGGFSVGNIMAMTIFGAVGFVAFMYGKKNANLKPTLIGIVLMVYPYFISNTILLYAVGAALCLALYLFRD